MATGRELFPAYLTEKRKIMENLVPLESTAYSNYTDFDKHNPENENNEQAGHHKSLTYEEIGIMVVSSVFCLLGILGNALVIWFAVIRMKKTVNVLWFLNLAIADFFIALFSSLNYTEVFLGYKGFDNMCKLIHFLLYINLGVSILQITAISIDRYICVVFPVWCHNHRRPRLAYIIVLIIWMISFAGSMVAIIHSVMIIVNDRVMCVANINESTSKRKIILQFFFVFLLPLVIITFCYIVIVMHVRKKSNITSSRPLKTTVAVIIAFFICLFPTHLNAFLGIFKKKMFDSYLYKYLYLFATLLIIMNTCINPILYVFIGQNLKEKVCGSIQARLEKAFIEDKSSAEEQEMGTGLERNLKEKTFRE
ncbi:chemerin-like receptor 1 [Dendropsophus ebraccatus]|uniref:chemerin-like receptor 1 n=1 Tax=Dendropsophus ebraccatus TaxID=150705 RepID=UPI0038310FE3